MERRPTAKLSLVVGEEGREVESGDGVEEKIDEVALGKPVMWRGWEEVALVIGPIAIRLVHATLEADRERLEEEPRHYSKVRP
jgi:hypothetical protein